MGCSVSHCFTWSNHVESVSCGQMAKCAVTVNRISQYSGKNHHLTIRVLISLPWERKSECICLINYYVELCILWFSRINFKLSSKQGC